MRLRPRYSLLTLLLLTAAVAVGIKLWRGPHRAVMSDPPTAAEQVILEQATMTVVHAEYLKPLRYEYDYVRTWEGLDCSTVVGRPTGEIPILVIPSGMTMQFMLERSKLSAAIGPTIWNNPKTERLVFWAHSGQKLGQPKPAITISPVQFMSTKCESYYLSSHKRLYVDAPKAAYGIYVRSAELSDVTDPAVRARIEEELASIPDPK